MKTHLLVPLVGLAISFALPTFAQEKEEVKPFAFTPIPVLPQLVQQIEAINRKFDEAINKHDAAAVAAFFTANATLVTPQGSFSGRDSIAKFFTDDFQRWNPSDRITKLSYVYAFGNALCGIGGLTMNINAPLPRAGAYLIRVYTRVRYTWQIRAEVANQDAL